MREAITIRHARAEDARALMRIKEAVWTEEESDLARVSGALAAPGHVTLVALAGTKCVAFLDSFRTVAADGTARWELDLLAVHPDYQGRGIGWRLVTTGTTVGLAGGMRCIRGLVHADNHPCRALFAGAGFGESAMQLLYLAPPTRASGSPVPASVQLIPVTTMSYQGVWVEGKLSREALVAAPGAAVAQEGELVGLLIPLARADLVAAAEELGYSRVGQYSWWSFPCDDP